jgi:hypothetical protein
MRDDRGEAAESRSRRGHLTLVHSRPGTATVSRRSARAQTWGVPAARTALRGGRAGGVDTAIFSQALGDLIIAAGGKVPGRVVFAPAAGPLDAGAFVRDLASHSRRIGLAVLSAEITDVTGRTGLRWHDAPGMEQTDREPLALDLFNPRWPEDFANWRGRTARFADMVLIAGPSLDRSVDAALVASRFDGLVVLAHRGLTQQSSVDDAVRRSRGVGANLFGVAFIDGAVPSWLRQPAAVAGRPRTPARP